MPVAVTNRRPLPCTSTLAIRVGADPDAAAARVSPPPAGAASTAPDTEIAGGTGASTVDELGTGGSGGGSGSAVYLQGEDETSTLFLSAFGGDGAEGVEEDGTTAWKGIGG